MILVIRNQLYRILNAVPVVDTKLMNNDIIRPKFLLAILAIHDVLGRDLKLTKLK